MEYGDGVAAVLLSYTDEPSHFYFSSKNYGEHYKVVYNASLGSYSYRNSLPNSELGYTIDGKQMNSFIIDNVPNDIIEFLNYFDLKIDEHKLLVTQQTSKIMLKTLAIMLDLKEDFIPFVARKQVIYLRHLFQLLYQCLKGLN